jgi:activator of HSP90 ATPase
MKTLRQTAMFNASPTQVYLMLMDPRRHAAFSGAPAKIAKNEGGKFEVYGGYVLGEHIALVPGKLIVQSWRGKDWPRGHMSTVVFSLAKSGKGTKLTFTHVGIPDDQYAHIAKGWKQMYWQRMQAAIAGKKAPPAGM